MQGVGFRYTARGIARGHNVAGFVQNLDDGRVLLVVEGEPADIEGYLAELSERMEGFIRGRTVTTEPATGQFGAPRPGALTVLP